MLESNESCVAAATTKNHFSDITIEEIININLCYRKEKIFFLLMGRKSLTD